MLTSAQSVLTQALVAARPDGFAAIDTEVRSHFGRLGHIDAPIAAMARRELSQVRRRLRSSLVVQLDVDCAPPDLAATADRVTATWRSGGAYPVAALGPALFPFDGACPPEYAAAIEQGAVLHEHLAPGWAAQLRQMCAEMVDAAVSFRDGFAQPGFIVLDSNLCAGYDGDAHFDWEGIALHPTACLEAPGYTFVLPVQLPQGQGGINVWDLTYGEPNLPKADELLAPVAIDYQIGSWTVIDSRRLHQIAATIPGAPRVVYVAHLAEFPEGWRLWL